MGPNFAFFLPVMFSAFAIAFVLVWRWGAPAAGWWAAGFGCTAAAFWLPAVDMLVPWRWWSLVADALFASGFLFYGQAMLERWRPGWLTGFRIGIVAVSTFACGLAMGPVDAPLLELVASDFGCFLLIAIPLVAGLSRLRHVADRVLLAAGVLVALDNLARMSTVLMTRGTGDFLSSDYAYLMQALACVFGLFLALAALGACILDIVTRHRSDAERDPLTGTLNRRGFDRAIAAIVPDAARSGWVISCDIDRFKQVNDRFGHAAGDRVIASFAASIVGAAPPDAPVARFGGEEFVIFLPACDAARAASTAEAIRTGFGRDGAARAGLDHRLTASFGLSGVHAADQSVYDAVGRADRALYEAKNSGRDRVSVARYLREAVAHGGDSRAARATTRGI